MQSSSDENFAWTNTDSDNSEIFAVSKHSSKKKSMKREETRNDEESSDSPNKYETRLESANVKSSRKKEHKKKHKHDCEQITNTEEDIDYDSSYINLHMKSSRKKKHKKKHKHDCEQITNTEEDIDYDSSYMNLKVKQEEESFEKLGAKKNVKNNSVVTEDSFGDLDDLVKNEVKREKKKKKKKHVDDTELDEYNKNEIKKYQNADSIVHWDSLDDLDGLAKKELQNEKKKKNIKCVDGVELEKSIKKQNNNNILGELDDLVRSDMESKKKKKKTKKNNSIELYKSDEIESKKSENSDKGEQGHSLSELDELVNNEMKIVKVAKKVNEIDQNKINEEKSKESPKKQLISESNQLNNGNISSDSKNSEDMDIAMNNAGNLVKTTVSDSLNTNNKSGTQATLSILGRIQFENDDVEMLSDNDKSYHENYDSSAKIKKFINNKKNLRQLDATDEKSVITSDDEVWLVKCPQEVLLESFIGKNITLDNKCKLKINGEAYCGAIEDKTSKIIVMTSEKRQFIIKNININGSISFKKRLPKPNVIEDNLMRNNRMDFIPLPETKCRHPLFGSNYLQSINIPKSVKDQLNGGNNELLSTKFSKKKKKHKKHYNLDSVTEHTNQTEFKPDESTVVKKAKKRKHSIEKDNSAKKLKKVKREANSSDVWGSEQAIAENLFNF